MQLLPYKASAYKLLHEGAIALAQVETNGIRIDVPYLKKTIKETAVKIKGLEEELIEQDVSKEWRKMFGKKMNLDSTDQLGKVLFDKMGFKSTALTKSKKYKVDEKSLETLDIPFVQDYLKVKKLRKIYSTYLVGLKREVVDGYLHPFFNLHIASTFRSSSSDPNFQNIPVRNPELGRLVRTAFIARLNSHLVEVDYSQIEVGIAACYHKDPSMITYLNDKSKDMHRDAARDCYMLPQKEMVNPVDKDDKFRIKQIRYCGKNMFVFPEFYGDWYIDCARSLWEATKRMKLKTRDGTSLIQHLRSKGITKLGDLNPEEKPIKGTFEKHIQEVEKKFWNERFPIYTKWKKDWINKYQKNGYLLTKTGFICQGFMKRNEIINYPVQGPAFHCLLWSLIRLQKELKKRNMKSLIVGQIHDSIVADVPANELKDFLVLAQWVMVTLLKEKWKWITVPLEIEAEVTPLNGCWADKKEMKI